MKQNKGFTLIEMLVVIAIIGILSAVVLTALGPARSKAKDTRIIADVNQVRSIGEINYNASGGEYTICDTSATSTSALNTDITNQGGTLTINCSTDKTRAAYSSTLSTGNYCVDTAGKTSANTASGGSC